MCLVEHRLPHDKVYADQVISSVLMRRRTHAANTYFEIKLVRIADKV